jgi:hypothetical protein
MGAYNSKVEDLDGKDFSQLENLPQGIWNADIGQRESKFLP